MLPHVSCTRKTGASEYISNSLVSGLGSLWSYCVDGRYLFHHFIDDHVHQQYGDGSADGAATGAVAAAQFPRIFITTSMNDTRVLYVEPLKWLARLQSAGVDAVAKIEVEAGHGGLSGRYKQWEEVSYENAWCMDVMGLAH